MKLSDKIFIDEAIELLEYQNKSKGYVVESLINEQDITTYFDINVTATLSTGYDMQPINQDGDELPHVNGEPPIVIEGPDKKILEAIVNVGNTISVNMFEHGGELYCGADYDGTILRPIDISFEHIYFAKSEIQMHHKLPTKKAGIQEQRINAFKYWLVGNSGRSIHDEVHLQLCYEELGSPTKNKVMEKLVLMNHKLFQSGQDDFGKAMGFVIQFKQGTGKHRDC